MKIGSLFIWLSLVLFFALDSMAQNINGRRYSFKSMIVEYKTLIRGDKNGVYTEIKGAKTIWIDSYGAKEAEKVTEKLISSAVGNTTSEDKCNLTIMDGRFYYTIDLLSKLGTKMEIGKLKTMSSMVALNTMAKSVPSDAKLYSKEFLANNGGKWLGTDTYKGRVCDKIELLGLTEWIYKGVVVKIEGSVEGIITLVEATEIKEDVMVPASVFALPDGVKIKDVPLGIIGSDDGYENDKINAVSTITLPFVRFKSSVGKINQLGFMQISSIEQDGEYMSVFMKSDSEVFMVQATSITDLDVITGEDTTVLQKLTINGHEAKIVQVKESEEGETKKTNSVFIRYPEFGMNLIVAGSEGVTETLLQSVAQQLSF